MVDAAPETVNPSPLDTEAEENYRRRMKVGFVLFAVFFAFYMWVAIINTPPYREFAAMPCMGMPLGMFLSLAVFPVSWLILVVYFLVWR
ncbi:MAG TPA: hypothetical protein PKO06_13115 [Candidatus Ozemobacteraceae bacterium]|nr:hypothetical protein [Candidatus Ozemobacteraceae bacterium]